MRHPNRLWVFAVITSFLTASLPLEAKAPAPQPTPAAAKAEPSKPVVAPLDSRLSVDDLGFSASDTKSDPALQAKLTKRSHKLKAHQVMGLLTAIPMVGTAILAGNVKHNSNNRNLHMAVGLATTGMYLTTAYLALTAPKIPGSKHSGSTRLHRYLAIVHGTMMIATPILGAMAKRQLDENQGAPHYRIHGIANMHGAAAALLLISYGAAMSVMVINF
jgi:hypothetical protein